MRLGEPRDLDKCRRPQKIVIRGIRKLQELVHRTRNRSRVVKALYSGMRITVAGLRVDSRTGSRRECRFNSSFWTPEPDGEFMEQRGCHRLQRSKVRAPEDQRGVAETVQLGTCRRLHFRDARTKISLAPRISDVFHNFSRAFSKLAPSPSYVRAPNGTTSSFVSTYTCYAK